MAEKSDFTPEETALHGFWLDTFAKQGNVEGKGTEGRAHREIVASTMFSVALMAWHAFHEDPADTARRLYLLSLNFAEKAGLSSPEATLLPEHQEDQGTKH